MNSNKQNTNGKQARTDGSLQNNELSDIQREINAIRALFLSPDEVTNKNKRKSIISSSRARTISLVTQNTVLTNLTTRADPRIVERRAKLINSSDDIGTVDGMVQSLKDIRSELTDLLEREVKFRNFEYENEDGETLLHLAMRDSSTDGLPNIGALKFLIERGHPLDLVNKKGETALHKLLLYAEIDSLSEVKLIVEAIKILSNAGADFEIVSSSKNGKNVLHLARHKDILQTLCEEIQDRYGRIDLWINAQDAKGNTPLHSIALRRKRQGVTSTDHQENVEQSIKILIKYGANCTNMNDKGNTIIHSAVESFDEDTLRGVAKITTALSGNITAEVRVLGATNALIDNKNYKGFSPLHLAILSKHNNSLALMEILSDWGANINLPSGDNRFPSDLVAISDPNSEKKRHFIKEHKLHFDHVEMVQVANAIKAEKVRAQEKELEKGIIRYLKEDIYFEDRYKNALANNPNNAEKYIELYNRYKNIYDAILSTSTRNIEMEGSSKSRVGDVEIGYVRHEVLADGNCGYTAFGIDRPHAYQLIRDNLNNVKHLLESAVREVLLIEVFFDYLRERGDIENNETLDHITNNIEQHADNLKIINAYVDYDIRDRKVDAGWAHPAVLQALAHIQGIELHIWQLGHNEVLIPHQQQTYAIYKPQNPRERVDLLFVNGNHFERLDIQGGFDKEIYQQETQKSENATIQQDLDWATEGVATGYAQKLSFQNKIAKYEFAIKSHQTDDEEIQKVTITALETKISAEVKLYEAVKWHSSFCESIFKMTSDALVWDTLHENYGTKTIGGKRYIDMRDAFKTKTQKEIASDAAKDRETRAQSNYAKQPLLDLRNQKGYLDTHRGLDPIVINKILEQSITIKDLLLDNTDFDDQSLNELALGITKNKSLEKLTLTNNKIQGTNITVFLEAIRESNIKFVDLSSNPLNGKASNSLRDYANKEKREIVLTQTDPPIDLSASRLARLSSFFFRPTRQLDTPPVPNPRQSIKGKSPVV